MWNWLRNKLGIKDYEDELIDINSKIYMLIKLVGDKLDDSDKIIEELSKTTNKLDSIESKIKAIPKEMVIKNVLSI